MFLHDVWKWATEPRALSADAQPGEYQADYEKRMTTPPAPPARTQMPTSAVSGLNLGVMGRAMSQGASQVNRTGQGFRGAQASGQAAPVPLQATISSQSLPSPPPPQPRMGPEITPQMIKDRDREVKQAATKNVTKGAMAVAGSLLPADASRAKQFQERQHASIVAQTVLSRRDGGTEADRRHRIDELIRQHIFGRKRT